MRTDPAAKKHEGISFLLIDMDDPGVAAAPIRLISGSSPFCETFFDDVRVPARNLVGELNNGWTIAKRLLEHERKIIGGIGARSAATLRQTPSRLGADATSASATAASPTRAARPHRAASSIDQRASS